MLFMQCLNHRYSEKKKKETEEKPNNTEKDEDYVVTNAEGKKIPVGVVKI